MHGGSVKFNRLGVLFVRGQFKREIMQGQGVVWVPDGQYVRPIFVRVGLTDADDLMAEVQGEGLTEGMKIVTGQEESEAGSAGSNPFLPKPPNGGKGGPPPPM